MTEYPGRSHCGAVAVTFRTARAPAHWPLRRCTCSFCVRFGGIYTSDATGEVVFRTELPLRTYQFGQRTADFLFCPHCGVFFGARTDIDGQPRGVLSVRVFEGLTLALEGAQPMVFDEESVDTRQARRARHWTPFSQVAATP